jgi:integrase
MPSATWSWSKTCPLSGNGSAISTRGCRSSVTAPGSSLTAAELELQLNEWERVGLDPGDPRPLSAGTVKHIRTAINHLYNKLDAGLGLANPVEAVPKPTLADPEERGLTFEELDEVLNLMDDRGQGRRGVERGTGSKTRARLRVMAMAAIPHVRLMRLKPEFLDLDEAAVYLEGRRKGKGTTGQWFPLAPRAVEAFREFIRLDCWGTFSTSSMRHSFLRAWRKANVRREQQGRPLLPPVRPYDVRHTFGTAVVMATGDERAAQLLLDHSDVRTTRRYTRRAQLALKRRHLEQVAALQVRTVTTPTVVTNSGYQN